MEQKHQTPRQQKQVTLIEKKINMEPIISSITVVLWKGGRCFCMGCDKTASYFHQPYSANEIKGSEN
jgi:hypothetical protein